jgi:hypothetical protein
VPRPSTSDFDVPDPARGGQNQPDCSGVSGSGKKRAKEQWLIQYIDRWLKAPVQEEDGQKRG